ncbi:hypothetical protein [Candidatus Palauibacter sp.]|uniref:hypothetical protein n=1 Tax=Candidatus Palauibacter sp. TaxID=3101350 RepID=UPI003AF2D9A0
MLTLAGLAHPEYGVESIAGVPVAGRVIMLVAAHALSAAAAVINAPLYFATLAGILLAVSKIGPGHRVSFRQLFSATVHAAYILLAGHALRLALAVSGVELAGPAEALLPAEDPPVAVLFVTLSFGSVADAPPVGVFEMAFHALLGVAYCRIRGQRLIVGAAWGVGISLLVDILWLLLGAGI